MLSPTSGERLSSWSRRRGRCLGARGGPRLGPWRRAVACPRPRPRRSRRRPCRRSATPRRAAARRGLLLADDLLEFAPDVAEHVVELVTLEHLLAPALETIDQVAQAGHVATRRVTGPPATFHQAPERLGKVALGHDVVGERPQDLVGVEVGHLLAAVPRRVARRPGERICGRFGPGDRRSGPLDLRPQITRSGE